METADRAWDASPLIGALLIIPALIYLSFWWQQDWGYLHHALTAKALVYWIEVRHDDKDHTSYYTWVYFNNRADQDTYGWIYGSVAWATPGDVIDIYYLPGQSDIRFGGWRGIWGGLYMALGTIVLGIVLSSAAVLAARRRRVQLNPDASVEAIAEQDEEWEP